MGLYLPPGLRWLGFVAGSSWPADNEDDYWNIADAWAVARDEIRTLLPGGSATVNLGTVESLLPQAYPSGDGVHAILAAFNALGQGDGSLEDLADRMQLVVDAANQVGAKIQELKIMIIISLMLLAWEIMMAWLYPPTAPAAEAAAIGSTRLFIQEIAAQASAAIERICGPLLDVFRFGNRVMATAVKPVTGTVERVGSTIRGAIEEAAGKDVAAAVSYFPKIAWEKAPATMKFVAGQDLIAQMIPIMEGRNKDIDWEELGVTLLSTVAGTTLAAVPVGDFTGATLDRAFDQFGADTSRGLAGAVRGLTAGAVGNEASTVVTNVIFDLATTGTVDPSDWDPAGLVGGFTRSMITGSIRGYIGELGGDPIITPPVHLDTIESDRNTPHIVVNNSESDGAQAARGDTDEENPPTDTGHTRGPGTVTGNSTSHDSPSASITTKPSIDAHTRTNPAQPDNDEPVAGPSIPRGAVGSIDIPFQGEGLRNPFRPTPASGQDRVPASEGESTPTPPRSIHVGKTTAAGPAGTSVTDKLPIAAQFARTPVTSTGNTASDGIPVTSVAGRPPSDTNMTATPSSSDDGTVAGVSTHHTLDSNSVSRQATYGYPTTEADDTPRNDSPNTASLGDSATNPGGTDNAGRELTSLTSDDTAVFGPFDVPFQLSPLRLPGDPATVPGQEYVPDGNHEDPPEAAARPSESSPARVPVPPRSTRTGKPQSGSAMRAKKRPKQRPPAYNFPMGTIPVEAPPDFIDLNW
ncbi:MAG: hypothetical protein J2P17_01700 [Mycobacterium sp.]|nr:hypothetical protein [Mycobacterium sp.]